MSEELRRALEQAAGEDPQLDLTDEVWRQGRTRRRRRHVTQGVGGFAAVALVAGAFALGGGFTPPEAGVGPALPTVEDEATGSAPVQTYALPTPTPSPTPTSAPETSREPASTATVEATGEQEPTGAGQSDSSGPVPTTTPAPTTPDPVEPTGEPTPTATSSATATATSTGAEPGPGAPPSSEPPPSAPPEVTCSATGLGGTVVPGEAPPVVVQRAQSLLDGAVACDPDFLVQAAAQDQTVLSLGLVTPEEVFALPEPEGEMRYALLVQTLSGGPPVVQEEGEETWYVWSLAGSTGWRTGFTPDGGWSFFLAGD